METSSILCISISVQTFQFAVKTFYIYFVYIWHLYKAKAIKVSYLYCIFCLFMGGAGCSLFDFKDLVYIFFQALMWNSARIKNTLTQWEVNF